MSKINLGMDDQAAGLRNLSRIKSVKVIAVTAGKGGVGKSNVSVNLAVALAKNNKRVMLLDADLSLGNIDIMLGLHTKYDLSHVIQGSCHLNDILLEGPYGLKIIPAASGTEFMAQLGHRQHAGIIDAFNEITEDLDYMIIDTAAGISDTVLSFTRSAQELLVVVCDEPTSLTDSYALIKVMSKRYGWSNFHIVANMVRSEQEGLNLFKKLFRVSEQFLDVQLDYLGAIPFDEHVHKAIKNQEPVLMAYPDSSAACAMNHLALGISRWSFKSLLGGNTSFFLERLVMDEL